jgi:hypothetical protein
MPGLVGYSIQQTKQTKIGQNACVSRRRMHWMLSVSLATPAFLAALLFNPHPLSSVLNFIYMADGEIDSINMTRVSD